MKKIHNFIIGIIIIISVFLSNIYFVNAATYVANVRLYSTIGDNHSWLVVKNTSSSSIYVGGYLLPANNTVTIGTWGNIKQHKGIWYNLEGYFNMASHVSVSKNINNEELTKMNIIINMSDSWGYLNNCSSFAKSVWNTISSTDVSAGSINTPSSLAKSIKSKFSSSYSNNYSIPSKTKSQLGYYSSKTSYIKAVPIFETGNGSSSLSRIKNNNYLNFDNSFINSFE